MKQVFCFTVMQTLKSTGIKVTTVIFCAIALLSMPILHLVNEKGGGGTEKVDKVLVWDETGLNLGDFSGMKEKDKYKNTEFALTDSEKEVKGATLLLHIVKGEEGYVIRYVAAADSDLSEMAVMELSEDFEAEFEKLREKSQGLNEEQSKMLHTEIETTVEWLEEDGTMPKADKDGMSSDQYNLFLGALVLFIFLISFSAESVSSSVVTEKSNKLVENLMISVETKNLILGKILGSLAVVVIQVVGIAVCGAGSALLTLLIYGREHAILPKQISDMVSATVLPGLNPLHVLLAACIFFLGVLQFAVLAGLFGAAISKMEDMGEGMKLYNVILIISAYVCLFMKAGSMAGGQATLAETVVGFIPLCSPFLVPMNLLIGQTSLITALLVIVIQVVFLILCLKLVTKVYTSMILYKGNVIKFRQILGLARGKEVEQ